MTSIPISRNAQAQVALSQYARNGLSPIAEFQNMIAERVGYAVRVRPKQVWRSPGQIWSGSSSQIPTSSGSERPRWRFAAHSAPYAQYLFVRMWQARQNSGTAADCYTRLRITDVAGTFVAEALRHAGSSGSAPTDAPYYFSDGMYGLVDANDDLAEIPANAPYFGTFTDFNYARIVAACVWEVAFMPNTDDGYPDISAGSGSPIYDKDRADAAIMINKQWAYGAQPLWHWSTDTDAGVRTVAGGDLSGSLTQTIANFTLSATGEVATSPPTYQAATGISSANYNTDLTVAWPTHVSGDVALLLVGSDGAGATLDTANGFTFLGSGGLGSDETIYVFWCRASSSSMSSPIINGQSNGLVAAMVTFRGCISSGNPYNVYQGANGQTDTAFQSSGVTTTLANTLVVSCGVFDGSGTTISGWTNASLASITERLDATVSSVGEVSFNRGLCAASGVKAAAGAVSSTSATLSASVFSAGVTIALKP